MSSMAADYRETYDGFPESDKPAILALSVLSDRIRPLPRSDREDQSELPESVKPAILALSVLSDRIRSLPQSDREDLFELFQAWGAACNSEDQQGIRLAMEEILAQRPITVRKLPLVPDNAMPDQLKIWAKKAGRKIRELRENAGMKQSELAEKAGLTQSHISRLENAEHSATNFTLEKIAKALGVSVGDLDPRVD